MFKICNKKPYFLERVLVKNWQVKKAIKKAAAWVDKEYLNKPGRPIMVAILKGAIPFYGQLMSAIKTDVAFDFIVLASYHGTLAAITKPTIVIDLINNPKNRDIILVEDVVDKGRSMDFLVKYLKQKGAKSVRVVTLVDKPRACEVSFVVDYSCFKMAPESFLIGYGLDVNDRLRNLPYIGEFKKEELERFLKESNEK